MLHSTARALLLFLPAACLSLPGLEEPENSDFCHKVHTLHMLTLSFLSATALRLAQLNKLVVMSPAGAAVECRL